MCMKSPTPSGLEPQVEPAGNPQDGPPWLEKLLVEDTWTPWLTDIDHSAQSEPRHEDGHAPGSEDVNAKDLVKAYREAPDLVERGPLWCNRRNPPLFVAAGDDREWRLAERGLLRFHAHQPEDS